MRTSTLSGIIVAEPPPLPPSRHGERDAALLVHHQRENHVPTIVRFIIKGCTRVTARDLQIALPRRLGEPFCGPRWQWQSIYIYFGTDGILYEADARTRMRNAGRSVVYRFIGWSRKSERGPTQRHRWPYSLSIRVVVKHREHRRPEKKNY